MPNSNDHARISIITGATSGIGEATARSFIEGGFAVVGSGRSGDKLAALEEELGPAFRGVAGDVADDAVVGRLFQTAEELFGPADVVVVNAGRGLGGSVKGADRSEFEEVMRVNVNGAMVLMQEAAQRMVETQREGFPDRAADIVVIGSVVGRHISPFSAAYGASKAAVHSLTEGLRRELGPAGVRVTLIEPGAVLTGFQAAAGYSDDMVQTFKDKFGPVLTGADVADAIYYVVTRPPHVHVCDILVRPTRQDYP